MTSRRSRPYLSAAVDDRARVARCHCRVTDLWPARLRLTSVARLASRGWAGPEMSVSAHVPALSEAVERPLLTRIMGELAVSAGETRRTDRRVQPPPRLASPPPPLEVAGLGRHRLGHGNPSGTQARAGGHGGCREPRSDRRQSGPNQRSPRRRSGRPTRNVHPVTGDMPGGIGWALAAFETRNEWKGTPLSG